MHVIQIGRKNKSAFSNLTMHQASDEKDVLALMNKENPCILLLERERLHTDFIEQVKKQNLKCGIIILGNEDSFSLECLNNISNFIYYAPYLFNMFSMQKRRTSDEILLDAISQEYIYALIYGRPERIEWVRPIAEYLNLNITPQIILTVICNEYKKVCHGLTNHQIYQLKRIILNCIRGALREKYSAVTCTLVGTDKVIVALNCEGRTGPEADLYANKCAQHIQQTVLEQAGYSVSVGISSYCAEPALLWKAYEQSFQALHSSFWQGNGQLLRYQSVDAIDLNSKTLLSLRERTKQKLILSIGQHSPAGIKETIKELIQSLVKTRSDANYIKSVLITLLSEIVQYCNQFNIDSVEVIDDQISATNSILQADSALEIESHAINFLSLLIEKCEASWVVGIESVIKIARAYINQYYADDLNLSMIAEIFGYSASYFSRNFKKHTNASFSDYLLQTRIEHARKQLLDLSISIDDIAYNTGFHSRSYFSSVFKRKTGKTPHQFRLTQSSAAISIGD